MLFRIDDASAGVSCAAAGVAVGVFDVSGKLKGKCRVQSAECRMKQDNPKPVV